MRKLVFAITFVLVIGSLVYAQDCSVQAYFGSPDGGQVVKSAIVQAINTASNTIEIALLSFTDNDLGDAVIRAARRGVNVRVILGAGQDRMLGSQYKKLEQETIQVVVVGANVMLNHAFAVIDDQVVITGSYNWSDYSEKSRYDSVVIISCAIRGNAVKAFIEAFDDLWQRFSVDTGTAATKPAFSTTMQPVVIHSVNPAGECIQILNVTDSAIDISGWQLSDLEGTYQFPLDTILYPDQPYEICIETYNPAYDSNGMYLNDEHDEVLLTAPDGRIIDEKIWGKPG